MCGLANTFDNALDLVTGTVVADHDFQWLIGLGQGAVQGLGKEAGLKAG